MSSLGSPSLAIERDTRTERVIAGATLALCVIPWLLLDLNWAPAGCAAAAVAFLGFRHQGWLKSSETLLWTSDGTWYFSNSRGGRLDAELAAGSIFGPCIWLKFCVRSGPRQLFLIRGFGGLTPDLHRRLTVRLRLDSTAISSAMGSDSAILLGKRAN
ncbi:MAG TPA: hypothetical protein VK629_02590 [Steroidobacteraceae bacterium]|nr:hypothetical protein [Steroidobacteraceae bacterium]